MQSFSSSIISLPDSQVLGEMVSLESLKAVLHENPHVIAIDLESHAMLRALQQDQKAQENCLGIFYEKNNIISLSVFLNNQKIFFYQEKNVDKRRLLDLFKKNFPEIIIEKYYDGSEELIQKGLNLWDPKTCKNFLPKLYKEEKSVMKSISKTILYAFLILLVLHGGLLLALHSQDETISELADNVQKLKPVLDLQSRTENLNKLLVQQALPVNILETIKTLMPDGVFLDSLDLENHEIFMNGKAQTQAQMDVLLAKLKTNKLFINPQLKNSTPDTTYPPYQFSFVITAGVQS